MPIVLTSNELSASGHTYDDRTGISYEYPRQYRKRIVEGDRFVYYRGTRVRGGKRQVPVYFGVGVVGETAPRDSSESLWTCTILDYQPFPSPVPFKDEHGTPLEAGGTRTLYYQQGVRTLTEAEWSAIVTRGFPSSMDGTNLAIQEISPAYASPSTSQDIDEYAMLVGLDETARHFPESVVTRMPHNNPGFDILVTHRDGSKHFIEVKGTTLAQPRFYLTEGERLFSESNAGSYTLLLVYGIDLATLQHRVWRNEGPVSAPTFDMGPIQWLCIPITEFSPRPRRPPPPSQPPHGVGARIPAHQER